MYGRAHEDERDSDTDSYLTEAHDQSALRASYGHTGETRSPGPSESDVGVSAQRLVVDSARSNSMNRKGRDDELCERAMEVMLSLSHWQGLAAPGRPRSLGPDRHKRPGSIPFRDLGRNGLSGVPAVKTCMSAAIVQTNMCVAANCEPRLYVFSSASRPYSSSAPCFH